MPPAPGTPRTVAISETREGGVTVRGVRLGFGPDHRAAVRVQMLIAPGEGPFAVFPANHLRRRPWVNIAVRRGYSGCS